MVGQLCVVVGADHRGFSDCINSLIVWNIYICSVQFVNLHNLEIVYSFWESIYCMPISRLCTKDTQS